MDKIAVLIPCFNESNTIGQVVHDFKQALPEATIYVYDNNSTDKTAEIAEKAGAIVRYETRQGKGNVIRSMFREIDAECYVMVDGDDTYPANHARSMVNKVLIDKADMVIGDRLSSTYFSENKRPFHNIGNILVRKMINHLFHGSITDIMTGYRAFSWFFVKTFPVLSHGFEIETEMTIHAMDNNMRIASIPVNYRDRPEGSKSKLNTFSDGARVLKTIGTLVKDCKPLPFFSVIAILLMLTAIIMFIPVFNDYMITGYVERFPTLIVSGIIGSAALLVFSCGLILDTQGKKSRQSFEIQMNLIKMQNPQMYQGKSNGTNYTSQNRSP